MKLPENMRIRVLADAKPLAGMFVLVEIRTVRKNSFMLTFGPTDASGEVLITRQELIAEGEKAHKFFMMDYGHPEVDFSGEIILSPLDQEALQRAVEAYHMYREVWAYPTNHLENIQLAQNILEMRAPLKLSVVVETTSEDVVVLTETVEA